VGSIFPRVNSHTRSMYDNPISMKKVIAATRPFRVKLIILFLGSCFYLLSPVLHAQSIPLSYGYNGVFLAGGDGLEKPIAADQKKLAVDSPWSMYCWIWIQEPFEGPTLIAGMGKPLDEYSRYFALKNNKLVFRFGVKNSLETAITLTPKTWHLLAATFDGTETHLYSDGEEVGSGKLTFGEVSPILKMAPTALTWPNGTHFAGKIASFTWVPREFDADQINQLHKHPVDFSLINFEPGSKAWPVQTITSLGLEIPQDPSTLPRSKAPFSQPVVQPLTPSSDLLQPISNHQWVIADGWRLTEAARINASGEAISQAGFNAKAWMSATVPGTVLTTMVDRGIYPDPDFGLNNLAIPETLNKQDYWYRTEFIAPKFSLGQNITLVFNGINYAAVVWLNGHRLGAIKGAFIRGTFDVTNVLKPGQKNALAVQISPPPHPGVPHEQSISAGPGPNGGMMCVDGPTFVATEGWDWIPAIRDRDTGIWQDVTLQATRQVKIGDAQVITTLPLPNISSADVDINVPLENLSSQTVQGDIRASFDQTTVVKHVILPPGESIVRLTPSEFHQLAVEHPRLWWPNGYGKPELYQLKLTFSGSDGESDVKQLRFGIREITYELSLLDSTGHLRRVEISPTTAKFRHEQVVDVTHAGMRKIPAGWVASLLPDADTSPAVKRVDDNRTTPYLVIKVNGVRIACKGGNWGMDDMMKRVSRKRLEPYFRLDRDANLNIIRNWVGQNTEEVFYDLADEYGMLVWNDFWESTQDDNLEPQDPALFLANARDTILRFRNHPSIVMWCGRNEGVPQPIINTGLIDLVRSLDGTRYYSPSSNQVNLQDSGPYSYQDPAMYFTTLNRGFSVEVGTPSMSTLESFRSTIAKPDQWPISDAWAYHDWHQSGNGDVAQFMEQLDAEFGAATSLPDFERKAQMLNYVDHRAIFEGFNAHLWAPNSGRLLWMTQPAWPSTMWQILSHDYDTQASFYAVKKACEPIHVQLNLSNYDVAVVNTTRDTLENVSVSAKVYSLQDKLLLQHTQEVNAVADAPTPGFKLDLAPLLSSGMVFVRLELKNSAGQRLSDNFYWLGKNAASYRQMNDLPAVTVSATASVRRLKDQMQVDVQLENHAATAALAVKLTLQDAVNGARILPAYLSDNYVSLLPGETRSIEIQYPISATQNAPQLAVRGWNISPIVVPISHP
jgi:hypothetical protein